MKWRVIDIPGNDVSDLNATTIMEEFHQVFLSADAPEDAHVHHVEFDDHSHRYFFSPGAVAIAATVLDKYLATPIHGEPDLKHARKLVL